MECPKCQSPMETVVFEGVEVDRCTGCKGLWFDMLEHEKLKDIEGSEAVDSGDVAKGADMDAVDVIQCPKCRTQMIRMVDKDQPHIRYESCGVCYGVFFDAGEFTDFKDRSIRDFFRSLTARARS